VPRIFFQCIAGWSGRPIKKIFNSKKVKRLWDKIKNINRRIVLAFHPKGAPTQDNFRLEKIAGPVTEEGEVLLLTSCKKIKQGELPCTHM
jgi:hypothetical protein